MRARRVDANQAEIVAALREVGCTVLDMSRLGGGAPDLAVGYGGLTILCEVKDGAKPPSARKLTPAEQEWQATWTGGCRLIESVEDALETAATLRKWSMRLYSAN